MMGRLHRCATGATVVLLAGLVPARADETVVYETITAGFAPHVVPAAGGRVDWTSGHLLADGEGHAQGRDNQQMLLARRAAVLDAAANALAIAAGINVDAGGRTGGMRNGRTRLEGCIKGHEVVDENWTPTADPPSYRVTIRVPLWGVKSVASIFDADHRRTIARRGGKRLPLVLTEKRVVSAVLVIDARGTGLEPCLFPTVITDSGDTLYDVTAIAPDLAGKAPPVRYVESNLEFEKLQAAVQRGGASPVARRPGRVLLAAHQPNADPPPETPPDATTNAEPDADTSGVAPPATEEPAAQPETDSQPPRRRHRRAVKAVRADGEQSSRIVLTAEDADRLRKDAESADLLRHAEIVVVVDSPAAGIQGRRDPGPGDVRLAAADTP